MNAEETLDYVLGQLEGRDREEFERSLRTDAALTNRVERLSNSLHQLLDDGADPEPPASLASRTRTLVAQAKRREGRRPPQETAPRRLPYRWADVAVAASIFFVGVLTVLPLLQYARDRRNHLTCVNNLQTIGQRLTHYASLHSSYPYPNDQPDAPTASFAMMLHDAGELPDLAVLDCPCNGHCQQPIQQLPKFKDLNSIRKSDPERYGRLASFSDYAFHVGYQRPTGHVGPLESRHAGTIPVIADKPDHDSNQVVKPGNSPNHGRRGQNVLFSDGNVKWLKSRFVSAQDPDLFLNNDNLPRPGTHAQDAVLLPGHSPVGGN